MSSLAKALEEYITIRRAFGYKIRLAARTLPKFVDFLERKRTSYITTALALQWAQEKADASLVTWSDRLTVVRRFAAWRSAVDLRTEIRPWGFSLGATDGPLRTSIVQMRSTGSSRAQHPYRLSTRGFAARRASHFSAFWP